MLGKNVNNFYMITALRAMEIDFHLHITGQNLAAGPRLEVRRLKNQEI